MPCKKKCFQQSVYLRKACDASMPLLQKVETYWCQKVWLRCHCTPSNAHQFVCTDCGDREGEFKGVPDMDMQVYALGVKLASLRATNGVHISLKSYSRFIHHFIDISLLKRVRIFGLFQVVVTQSVQTKKLQIFIWEM